MDPIQQRLAIIDRQLAGGDFHARVGQVISTCPLVFAAVGLIGGIVIQNVLGLSIVPWLALLSLFSISTILIYIVRNHPARAASGWARAAFCALACSVCLGAIRLIAFHHPAPNDVRNFVTDEPVMATIRGLIVTEPYTSYNPDWQFARFRFTDPPTSFYLKLTETQTAGGWAKACGTIRVQVEQPVLDLKAGDHVQAYCWLERFGPATNPGQFDTARYLALKNVLVGASVKSRDGIETLPSRPGALLTKAGRKMRQIAMGALLGNLPPDQQSRALLEALVLGYRTNIDSGTYRAFTKTGLLHFLSLSGMNVGILIAAIWWVARNAGLLKRASSVVCIVAIAVFMMVVPPMAPAVRAAIIGWVFCASFLFRRHSNPINTLSLAAIITLLIRPTQLFEPGWQLSFATVLGILLLTRRIEGFLRGLTGDRLGRDVSRGTLSARGLLKRLTAGLLTDLSVGFAAWIGGAGILLYHFYTITPLASIWTVLTLPLVGAIMTLGCLKMVLSFLLPTTAAVLGVTVSLLSDLFVWAVKVLSRVGGSEMLIGHVPLGVPVLYYCLVVVVGFAYFRRPFVKKAVCAAMVLGLAVSLGAAKWQRTVRRDLSLTALDVGHGQAILARMPGRANVLFEAGSLHRSDIGRRIITPFLYYMGIARIDAVVISHNDIDHVNGLPEVLDARPVGAVYANDAFFIEKDQWSTAKFLNDSLSEKGFAIRPLTEDVDLGGSDAHVRTLWPDKRLSAEQLSDNDKSLVSLIEFTGRRILLCSDIEDLAQRQILRLNPGLKADAVVVPHHGSVKTADPAFIESLDASVLIHSCDLTQYERLPRTGPKNNQQSLYTSANGAITVRIGRDGVMETTTFLSQKK